MSQRLLDIEPQTYTRHRLHTQERDWAETNCYADVWIELLHAHGMDPVAALPFTLAAGFEGDQWTFFKYPPEDVRDLYGLDVYEYMLWRPLTAHLEEQIGLGRTVLVELDSFHLPDTAGSAYKLDHVKTTVGVNFIDVERQELGYFHAQGYYHLSGDDFRNVFHLNGGRNPSILPPYCEVVRRAVPALQGEALLKGSLTLLNKHLSRLPETNPFDQFRPRFEADLQWLMNEPLETFHLYSFATLRQFGACYELAANYLKWLQSCGVASLEKPIAAIAAISSGAKAMQFQLARTMARKKPFDLGPVDQMASHWQSAMDHLKATFLT